MIAVTLHTTTGETLNLNVKTGWQDVTTAEYIGLQGKGESELLQWLTGLTMEQLNSLDNEAAVFFANLLSGFEALPKVECRVNVESETVGQFETVKSYLRRFYREDRATHRAKALPFVYGLYQAAKDNGRWSNGNSLELANTAKDLPASEVVPFALAVLEQVEQVSSKYDKLATDPDEAGEDEESSNDLEAFGFYPVLHMLSGGDILKHEDIMQKSVRSVYTHLLFIKKLAASQKEKAA